MVNIISFVKVRLLFVVLHRVINKHQKLINKRIIALKLKVYNFILIANYILMTQDSNKVFDEGNINYYLIIFGFP